MEQEERRRIQHKQQASWNFLAWREWTMRLLPKRLEGDQLPSEKVVTEILSIRMKGLWRVKGGHVSQTVVEETSVYAHSRDLQGRGARGEETHPAQAASFLEVLSMKGVNDEIAPKAAWRRPAAFRNSCDWDLVHKDEGALKSEGRPCLPNRRGGDQRLRAQQGPARAWSKRRRNASSTSSKLPGSSQHEGSERWDCSQSGLKETSCFQK